MSGIEQTVAEFLEKYNLCDKTVITGFSGGYDSMCLLNVLSNLREKFPEMILIAAHFNHNWRGEEALKEQEVCRIFAEKSGIEFYTKTAPNGLKKTENHARTARYEFFEDARGEYDADAVFTAHNFDDNAETLLYRIIKGTGITGLKGISEKRGYFYRPLLNIKRSEILDYCCQNNLSPNDDSSNSNTMYSRNYLRLNVFPVLEKINGSVKNALNTLALNAASDNALIEEYLEMLHPKVSDGQKIVSKAYKELSKPAKFRILYDYIQTLNLDYDYKKISEICDFVEVNINKRNGSTISLSSSLWLYADDKTIEVIPEMPEKQDSLEIIIEKEGEYDFGEQKFFLGKYNGENFPVFPSAESNFAYADLSEIGFPLTLRNRKDGDMISPFGMSGSMKLKKYMNAKGIPRRNRNNIPLLCSNTDVLWAAGVGLSSKIGVKDKPTHVIEIKDKVE